MDRRSLLKYLISTPLALTVDYEKLLWIPGEKKIFLPTYQPITLTIKEITDITMQTILPNIEMMMERDSFFFRALKQNRFKE